MAWFVFPLQHLLAVWCGNLLSLSASVPSGVRWEVLAPSLPAGKLEMCIYQNQREILSFPFVYTCIIENPQTKQKWVSCPPLRRCLATLLLFTLISPIFLATFSLRANKCSYTHWNHHDQKAKETSLGHPASCPVIKGNRILERWMS